MAGWSEWGCPGILTRHTAFSYAENFLAYQTEKNRKGCVLVWAQGKGNKWWEIFFNWILRGNRYFSCLWDILINIILILANECYLFGFFLKSLWNTTTVKLPMDFFFLLGEGLISERLCRLCLDASCSEVIVDREEIECWNPIIFFFSFTCLVDIIHSHLYMKKVGLLFKVKIKE